MASSMSSLVASANYAMVFTSSVIVMSILSWFFAKYNISSAHIIYEETIATITVAVSLFGLAPPLVRRLRSAFWVFNIVMSYLWLTSFIFSAQDWTGGRCPAGAPALNKCGYKKTVVAFNFLAFFFILCNVCIEALAMMRTQPKEEVHTKERPASSNAASEAA